MPLMICAGPHDNHLQSSGRRWAASAFGDEGERGTPGKLALWCLCTEGCALTSAFQLTALPAFLETKFHHSRRLRKNGAFFSERSSTRPSSGMGRRLWRLCSARRFTVRTIHHAECSIGHGKRAAWLRTPLRSLPLHRFLAARLTCRSPQLFDLQPHGEGIAPPIRNVCCCLRSGSHCWYLATGKS